MPPEVVGYADDVTEYEYDPEKSKQLLEEAGLTLPVEIEFWYPTDVSRPYMPDPKRNFEAFAASLNEAGFKVMPKTAPWSPDYLGNVDEGNTQVYLLGWTGDFGDPDNFVGTFFQTPQTAWGFENQEIFDIARRGRDGDRSGRAHRAVRGSQPDDHGLPPRRAVRAHEAGARVRRERRAATCRARSRSSPSPPSRSSE